MLNRHFPRQRPRRPAAQPVGWRRPSWLELLVDLVFTVLLAQLAQRLVQAPALASLRGFILLYVPVWWLWIGMAFYTNRYDSDHDTVHYLLVAVQLAGLLVLAACLPRALTTQGAAATYALTYVALRLVLLVEYARAWRYVPADRPYIRYLAIGFGCSIGIWSLSATVPSPGRYGLWALALLIELATPLAWAVRPVSSAMAHLPPDERHLPERMALFTLLVLGQVVSSATYGLQTHDLECPQVGATLLGGLIIVGLWWIYFNRLEEAAVTQLRPGKRSWPFWGWLYLHLPITVALALIGVGLTLVIAHIGQPALPSFIRCLLAGAVSGFLLLAGLLSWTSLRASPWLLGLPWCIAVRFTVAGLLLASGLGLRLPAWGVLGLVAGATSSVVLLEYIGPQVRVAPAKKAGLSTSE